MKQPLSTVVVTFVMLVLGVPLFYVLAQAPDPIIGTWEINLAKSTYDPGPPPKSGTAKYEAVEKGWKYSGKSVTADGKTSTGGWTAYFDGKDYPYTGDPDTDTISLKRIDRFTTEGTFKKAGKVTGHIKRVVSQDGKILTWTSEGTDAKGKPSKSVVVLDRR
jgi:hypothetical protein